MENGAVSDNGMRRCTVCGYSAGSSSGSCVVCGAAIDAALPAGSRGPVEATSVIRTAAATDVGADAEGAMPEAAGEPVRQTSRATVAGLPTRTPMPPDASEEELLAAFTRSW